MKKLLIVLLTLLVVALLPLGRSSPPTRTVVRGDSLSRIAGQEGVSVEQLRRWNGLRGDRIDIGQVLLVGENAPGRPLWRQLEDRLRTGHPEPPPDQPKELPASRPRRRPPAAPEPPSEVDAEAPDWPALVLPPAKDCLDAETGTGGGSFGRSQGLDNGQLRAAVDGFQAQALRCYDDHPTAGGSVLLDLLVGCDGRVLRSSVEQQDTGDPDFALCVAEVFRYAPFPAHARDEVEFTVPLHFTAP